MGTCNKAARAWRRTGAMAKTAAGAGVGKLAGTVQAAPALAGKALAATGLAPKPQPRKRLSGTLAARVLVGAAAAGLLALAVNEFPALRREIKIWTM